ncbi:DUF2306 domain-containing protein [Aquidulcibacter sp.]|uniref:DUF2306 domain-containing protein n=1 Tax=Aquidulcibacter sp. TaxID=2052990 RepID=UPI0028A773E7|nr:DUF2306 domain-containing protein [Aquidulcibacter sp.]
MTDLSSPNNKNFPSAAQSPIGKLLVMLQPLLGYIFAIGMVALAFSSFGPNVWAYILSQSFTPRAPDWQVFAKLPLVALIHIGGATSSLVLGGIVLFGPKGTPGHKMMGRIWALAMVTTALSSFFMKSFAPMLGQFGPIHILSVWTLYSLPRAIWYIRQGDVEGHLKTMRGLYFGLCLAGLMTFIPGRTFYALIFG